MTKRGNSVTATTRTTNTRSRKPKTLSETPHTPVEKNISINEILPKKLNFKCRNQKQKELINLILDKDIVFACGPAGSGKSYASIAKGVELLQDFPNKYNKILIIKPAVEAEEELGSLPGDLREKLAPYLASSIDIVDKLVGETTRINLEEAGILKIEPLGFIRGKTMDNCIVVVEETQNMSPKQVKTLLTRIGENCKMVISGDIDQSDKYDDYRKSGLYDAINRHKNIEEIGFMEFGEDDVVRHPIIIKILKNYPRTDPSKQYQERPKTIKEVIEPVKQEVNIKKKGKKTTFFNKLLKYFKW